MGDGAVGADDGVETDGALQALFPGFRRIFGLNFVAQLGGLDVASLPDAGART